MSRPYPPPRGLPPGAILHGPEVQTPRTVPPRGLPPGAILHGPEVQTPRTVPPRGLPLGAILHGPARTAGLGFSTEEPEVGKVERLVQYLDYVGGKARGGIRGALGGDPSDTASFGREFSDPASALGGLAPGGGLIPEIAEDESRPMSLAKHTPAFLAGLVADIGTDPLTWVSLGPAGAGKGILGRGLRFAGQQFPGTAAAGRAVQRGITKPVAEALVPYRRQIAEAPYLGAVRKMFTTGPMAGASDATRKIFDAARRVSFRTDAATVEAQKRAIGLRRLHRDILKDNRNIDETNINKILTDAIEKKKTRESRYTFPEAFKDTMPAPEYQALITARKTILGDPNAKRLIKEAKVIQKRIMDYEDRAWVRTGELGAKRRTTIEMLEKERQALGLEQGAADKITERILHQEKLALRDPEYIMHGFSSEGQRAFKKANKDIFGLTIKGGSKTFSTDHASRMARTLEKDTLKYPTVAEYNAAGRRGELEAFGAKPLDFDVFETNPIRLTMERELRGIPKVENVRFLTDVVRKYGVTKKSIQKKGNLINSSDKYGWIQVRNPETGATEVLYRSKTGPVKNRYFESEVRDHIDSVHRISTDPKEINIFSKLFDDVQSLWKSKTLAMFPAYHARNVVGNLWNNYLGGVTDPSWYIKGTQVQIGQKGTIGARGGVQYSFDEIRRLAKELGVENQGMYSTDIERRLQGIDVDQMGWKDLWAELRTKRLGGIPGMANALSIQGDDLWNIAGRRGGRFLENNARYTHFVKKLSDGLAPEEAAQSVMKYLFDYGDISRVAQQTLGRAFPFFRWTRFNLPLQVEALMTQPGKMSSLVHSKNVIEARPENEAVEDAVIAPFIREAFNIQTRRSEDGNRAEFFVLNNWIPAADLINLIPERAGHELLRMTTPIVKTAAEQVFNYDLFREREIERDKGELQTFWTQPLRKKTIHLLRNVRLLTEIDRLLKSSEEEPERLGPGEASMLENVFRTLTGIKLYGVDINLSRRIQKSVRRRAEINLRSMLQGARRRGETEPGWFNPSEVERIRERLREIREQ